MTKRAVLVIEVALLAATGCGGSSDGPESAVSFADSAGVLIVTSHRPSAEDPLIDLTGQLPTWSIGGGSDSAVIFGRINGLVSIGDTIVAVANIQSPPEVVVFKPRTARVQRFGRAGEGPGEFRAILNVWHAPPDTLIMYDPALQRVTLTDLSGSVLRIDELRMAAEQAPSDVVTMLVWDRFADGTYLMTPNQHVPPSAEGPGVSLRSISRYEPLAGKLSVIVKFPHTELARSTAARWGFDSPIFAPVAMYKAYGRDLLAGYPTSFAYEIIGEDTSLKRRVRKTWSPVPVTGADRQAYEDAQVAGSRRSVAEVKRILSARVTASTFPAYDRHGFVASDSSVWIPHYHVPRSEASNRWSVFGADGRWIRDYLLPPGFMPRLTMGRELVGIETDSLDVQSVAAYSFEGG